MIPFILLIILTTMLFSSSHCVPCKIEGETADCSSRSLNYVPQDLPKKITKLLLGDNNVYLNSSAFKRYRMLRYLDLSSNYLSDLGNSSFADLLDLVTLNLEDNQLLLTPNVYRPGVFEGLSGLQYLNTGGSCDALLSNLSSYPDEALSKLTSLENLTIDGIPHSTLGSGFGKLKNLTKLVFGKHCSLYCINETMFENTPSLRYLDMSNCHISDIHVNAFSRLPYIDFIDLSGNTGLGFDKLKEASFGLQNTSIRVVRMNKIVLPYAVCVIPPKDVMVYLQNTSIKELYLDHNNIEILEPGTLDFFPKSLEFMSVRDNRFTVGYYMFEFQKARGLKKIDVSDMAVGHYLKSHGVPSVAESKQNSGYIFQTIPIPMAPDVEHIVARNSIIKAEIPSVLFRPNKIKTIDISQNGIYVWKGPVYGLTSLQSLDLSMNMCSELDVEFFKNFESIRSFNASDNYLGDILEEERYSCVLCPLYNLETLDLSKNRFRKFNRRIFQNNTALTHLNLSYNRIEDLNIEFGHLKKLGTLNLRGNLISYIHLKSRGDLDDLQKTTNISIDLSDNPLACVCENINFLRWMLRTKVVFLKSDEYTCIDNNNTKKKLDVTLIQKMLSTCSSRSYTGLMCGTGSVFIIFLSFTVAGVIYRYRWKIKYLYYVARDRYLLQQRPSTEGRHFEYDAFISFADENVDMVNLLIARLEGDGRRLCVHHRDFRPGEPIGANIVKAVQTSRRTVIILSRHFLTSSWCRYEFEMARMESVYDDRRVIVVLRVGELDDDDLPRELLYLMRSDSYLEWPNSNGEQETFWLNLDKVIAVT